MTPHPPPRRDDNPSDMNALRRGRRYRATTSLGTTVGVYLGMETPHGDRAILLRNHAGTASIPIGAITAIADAA